MNIIVAGILIIIFLGLDISFIYLIWKNIENANKKSDTKLKNIIEQAKGRNLNDIDRLNDLGKNNNIIQSTSKIDDMRIASDCNNCTKAGNDMFATGKCHFCCTGTSSYLDKNTNAIYCLPNDPKPDPKQYTQFIQDPCSCTKETEDINQYGCCFPCCDGLNMYQNNGTGQIQCFRSSTAIEGYTLTTNSCDGRQPNGKKCPTYPQFICPTSTPTCTCPS